MFSVTDKIVKNFFFTSHLRFVKKHDSEEKRIKMPERICGESLFAEFILRSLPTGVYPNVGDILEFDFSFFFQKETEHVAFFVFLGKDDIEIGESLEGNADIKLTPPRYLHFKVGEQTGIYSGENEFRIMWDGNWGTPVLSSGEGCFPVQQFVDTKTGRILRATTREEALEIIQEVLRQLEESKE